jgi:hypothetical protein
MMNPPDHRPPTHRPPEQVVSWGFGDFVFRQGFDNVSSTIKARQAGFYDCIDSEAMFAQLFVKFRQLNFNLIKSIPPTLKYEGGLIVADEDFVIVHGRFSGFGLPVNWIAADILRIEDGILVEHWDVIQDEVARRTRCWTQAGRLGSRKSRS